MERKITAVFKWSARVKVKGRGRRTYVYEIEISADSYETAEFEIGQKYKLGKFEILDLTATEVVAAWWTDTLCDIPKEQRRNLIPTPAHPRAQNLTT